MSASMYVNELMRQAEEELEEKTAETDLTEEEIEAFEAEWNARIQSINTEGIPEEYMERYRPAVERYRELGGKWGWITSRRSLDRSWTE